MLVESLLSLTSLLFLWLGVRNIPDVFIQRKLLHFWTGVVTILLYFSIPHTYFIFLSILFTLFFLLYPGKLPGNRLGLAAFPLSVAFITYFFHSDARIWMLTLSPMFFADPMAALSGRYGGRVDVACGKTFLGGSVFFTLAFVIYLLLGIDFPDAFLISSVLTLIEMASPDGTDNLTVPLSAAILIKAWPAVPLWISFPVSVLVAFIIVMLGWLTLCGGFAVAALGTTMLFAGGIRWVLPLIIFVGMASIVGRLLGSDERRRDVNQVFANAGVPALLVVLYAITGNEIFYYMNLAAVASMLGDTLATEFGVRLSDHAYYIIGFKRVRKGTSGGVSIWGFVGAFLGILTIGIFAGRKMPAVVISGFLGTVIDSLVGALVEGRGYWNNDMTNFFASLLSSLLYLIFQTLF